MMNAKNLLAALLASLVSIVILVACTGDGGSADAAAGLDTPFQLQVGQTAELGSERLTVELLTVPEDSRCPEDVQCITAGQVSVLFSVAGDAAKQGDYTLTIGSQTAAASTTVSSDLTLSLVAVSPYPATSRPIDQADYVATFQFTAQ